MSTKMKKYKHPGVKAKQNEIKKTEPVIEFKNPEYKK